MKSYKLKDLYYKMKEDEIKRYKFRFIYNEVVFDVIFFCDETPFNLLFGALGTGFSFEANVNKGFDIDIVLPAEKYNKLKEILNIPRFGKSPFKMSDFFKSFCTNIPEYKPNNPKVRPQDVAVYRRNVDEANKIYFYGWKENNLTNEEVSDENLEKTKLLIGVDTYYICKRKNISSRWTDNPDKCKEITAI